MTREGFEQIHTWGSLYELMNVVGYDGMEGDLYETPEELKEGLINALANNIHALDEIRAMDVGWIDPNADVWTADACFADVINYYDYEFSDAKQAFEEWLEDNGYFDEGDDCEIESAPDNAAEMQRVSDDALDMLLFGA